MEKSHKKAASQLSSYIELSILMPCLNEAATIEGCIEEAKEFLQKSGIHGEILVIDNNSTDESGVIARNASARVINVWEKGYGNALRSGIQEARGQYCIMGDCDGSYDFYHLDEFVVRLREGYDLVMGNRLHRNMEKGAMPLTHKYIGVPFLSWLGRWLYHTNITDFHCGLRGFSTEKIRNLHLKSEGMEFASEMIGEAVKAEYKIIQIPIILRKDKRNHHSHMRPIRDGFRHIWVIGKGRQR